jgi:hypothetical protein
MMHRFQVAIIVSATLLLALPASAQTAAPAPTGAPINRMMDIWPGIVFVCVPDAKLKWSFPACEGIEKEAERLARTGQARIAIAGTPRAPADAKEAARQAGFDGERALSIVVTISPETGNFNGKLSLEATSRTDENPGVTRPLYRTIYLQSALLRSEATTKDAVTTTKTMLEALFEVLLRPVKR